ncbi:hypothetical protein E3C22_08745 [Jiella endophytica]|uniref:HEPN domain-containing protein n=1 Tax=Jiella endophytica TaxID=2558362 RepID=A0A4Y8RQ37_9HYPH|nr:hypothetical protein [Jiella endophytica]TFF25431.1 hypothetical protein E3C22_08745 [Jiella endophytica]
MIDELLLTAEALLRDSQNPASRRRAVSATYYAVFHALAELASKSLLPDVSSDSWEYVRTYRSLDHGPLKSVFLQLPLKDDARFRIIGQSVVQLQVERNRADYLPNEPSLFPSTQAADLIAQARNVIAALRSLGDEEKRKLAVCLLFRVRQE